MGRWNLAQGPNFLELNLSVNSKPSLLDWSQAPDPDYGVLFQLLRPEWILKP